MLFLGEALTTMIVYVWCRRNPNVRYNFFGLFTFQAPYLPWILVLFSVLFGGSVLVDFVGTYQSMSVHSFSYIRRLASLQCSTQLLPLFSLSLSFYYHLKGLLVRLSHPLSKPHSQATYT